MHVADQRVVAALALPAGNTALVSDLCQLSRSFVSPAEHVGEQIEGVAGCRASGRSAGTSDVGDECGDLLAQAVSSAIGSSSFAACLITFFRSIGCDLLLSRQLAANFTTLCRQIIYLLRLIRDFRGLVGITMSLGIPARRTCNNAGNNEQPDARVDPCHATTSPPAARYAASKCSILFSC
ncbi:hypothetical protein Bamb_1851 [Burkholderia ambifaria AMMD]|uniref:Uncharacterized protein n=1 Tax=Burkholderia ambifaria (strain ATCC BAA-244 / DSM 16087 / CCUG 44356 / LMG 19182 / AMMD) TaxID=339670 RepID=Q0BEL6_BURCM|nr:hypothetical protein Bamb_1851 [Burkholderia ambifaria AMMD]